MRCRSPRAQWTGVGRAAARLGYSIAQALTYNRKAMQIDDWIMAGYTSEKRKIEKRNIQDSQDILSLLMKKKIIIRHAEE